MFDRLLLGRLWAEKDQTWWEGLGRLPKGAKAIGFHGNQFVAMVTRKFSHASQNWPMVLIFCIGSLLGHNNMPAKNERYLPCGSRDST